jgi:hypothetical protein
LRQARSDISPKIEVETGRKDVAVRVSTYRDHVKMQNLFQSGCYVPSRHVTMFARLYFWVKPFRSVLLKNRVSL